MIEISSIDLFTNKLYMSSDESILADEDNINKQYFNTCSFKELHCWNREVWTNCLRNTIYQTSLPYCAKAFSSIHDMNVQQNWKNQRIGGLIVHRNTEECVSSCSTCAKLNFKTFLVIINALYHTFRQDYLQIENMYKILRMCWLQLTNQNLKLFCVLVLT